MAIAQRVWAFILDNEVKNVVVSETYQTADSLAKNIYGIDSFAVEITYIPTSIGHKYENGIFKDLGGNVIEPLPTTEQEVVTLKTENETLNQALTESSMLIAAQQEQIDEQSQAISELTILVAGGNA